MNQWIKRSIQKVPKYFLQLQLPLPHLQPTIDASWMGCNQSDVEVSSKHQSGSKRGHSTIEQLFCLNTNWAVRQWGVSSSNPTMSMIYILYFITYTVHIDPESRLAIQIQVDVFIYVHIHNQTLASSSANIHELSRSKSSLAEIGGNPLQWHAMDLNLTAWWNYIQHLYVANWIRFAVENLHLYTICKGSCLYNLT